MNYAIINEENLVTNVAAADAPLELNWIQSDTVAIGDTYNSETGEFIKPPAPPAPVPSSCTRRQGRLALLQNDLLDDVEDAIAAIPDPAQRRAAQIEYEADTWDRGNAFLQGMWAQLGGDEEGLDDLFRLAVTL